MVKQKSAALRNKSHRYSTHGSELNQIKGLMNLPNLNANSAFGNHAHNDSSDEDEPGKRSFTQEVDYRNKKAARKQIQNANYQSMVQHKQKLFDKSLNKLNAETIS